MIRLEHTVLPSPEQIEFAIEGLRNSFNSWFKSDSHWGCLHLGEERDCDTCDSIQPDKCTWTPQFIVGKEDMALMQRLSSYGSDHRKFMRMLPVCIRITAPLYWWKEADTYSVGTSKNSCSTMHKIAEKEFTLEDFSHEHLMSDYSMENELTYTNPNDVDEYCFTSKDILQFTIDVLNHHRMKYIETKDKKYWWQLIQLLPDSYNQTRNAMFNYEVLANIYKARRNHKLDEWRDFCSWIETLPYSDLITGKETK